MLSLQWTKGQPSSASEWIELTQVGLVSILNKKDLPGSAGETNTTSIYAGVQDSKFKVKAVKGIVLL